MSENLVAKFGGTSMAQPEFVEAIVASRPDQRLIVTSAPGKLPGDDKKMTDLLFDYNDHYVRDDPRQNPVFDEIMDRFTSLFASLSSKEADQLGGELEGSLYKRGGDKSFIASRGEHFSARRLALTIDARFFEARSFHFGENGEFDLAASLPRLQALGRLSQQRRIVVPGYYGFGPNGEVQLFDRGGSDRTGAILAAANGWNYENWTDTPGILSVDSRIVSDAQPVAELSREEVREGAHGGTGVLQGDTIIDLQGSDCEVIVKNTFDPDAPGTRILPALEAEIGRPIVALSGRDDILDITIRDQGMADRKKYGAQLLDRFGELGLSWEHMPTSQDALSIIMAVPRDDKQKAAVGKFVNFARTHRLSSVGTVDVSRKAIVYAVGEGLRDPRTRNLATIRLMGDILVANYTAGDLTSHRTSPSLAFLVEPEAMNPVIRAIYAREIGRTKSMI